jgi:Ni,Fe-hydrogenase III small subunit
LLAVLKRLLKHGIGTIPKQELRKVVGRGTPSPDVTGCNACGDCAAEYPTGAQSLAQGENRRVEEQLSLRIKEVFGRSLHIRHVDSGSCNGCEFEITALMNPVYDIQRFGIDFVASPRHADMLLITGGVTRNLQAAVRKTYDAAASPKMVVAIGACACGDGMVGHTYANLGGVDKIAPVTVYVPGCPPRPHAILEWILTAIERAQELNPK